jgi:hypothetical protein
MKFILSIFMIFLLVHPSVSWAEEKDCACKEVTCGPCQQKVTIGKIVKFCDWGDINVCKKVICENVSFYFKCLSGLNQNKSEPGEGQKELEFAYDNEKQSTTKKRNPASSGGAIKRLGKIKLETEGRIEVGNDSRVLIGETYSDVVVGLVKKTDTAIEVFHRGQRKSLQARRQLYVGDELTNISDESKNLVLSFEKGTVELKLAPKTKLMVQDPHSIMGHFQPFMYLVHGGLELSVTFSEGSFDLLAGQIVARIPGGKHQVQYEMGAEGLQVKVESFSQSLNVIRAQDLSGKTIPVQAGEYLSWVSETPRHLFTMDEKQALADEGFITPIFQMPVDKRRQLGLIQEKKKSVFEDWSKQQNSEAVQNRGLASLNGDLCTAPAAAYQQCAWSCEGNSQGAQSCQAKKNGVHCVRRVCNAAGQWSAPTAFASSYADLCPAEGVRVGDCSP